MLSTDFADWDARYRAAASCGLAEPASFVRELMPLLPFGPALDLACGAGRHTLLLAASHSVTAVDASSEALDLLVQHAANAGLSVTREPSLEAACCGHQGIQLVRADLEQVKLPPASFTLIVCVQYLQRSLFPQMEAALSPGGMLLFETYTRAQLEFSTGPRNPAYLLESGELRAAFPTLRTLVYRELRAGKGIASLLGQKPRHSTASHFPKHTR